MALTHGAENSTFATRRAGRSESGAFEPTPRSAWRVGSVTHARRNAETASSPASRARAASSAVSAPADAPVMLSITTDPLARALTSWTQVTRAHTPPASNAPGVTPPGRVSAIRNSFSVTLAKAYHKPTLDGRGVYRLA